MRRRDLCDVFAGERGRTLRRGRRSLSLPLLSSDDDDDGGSEGGTLLLPFLLVGIRGSLFPLLLLSSLDELLDPDDPEPPSSLLRRWRRPKFFSAALV